VRNAAQHAKATRIDISIGVGQKQLTLAVRNNGSAWNLPEEPSQGLGFRIMRHRTAVLEGVLSIEPNESGGTLLTCRVPIGPDRGRAGSLDPALNI